MKYKNSVFLYLGSPTFKDYIQQICFDGRRREIRHFVQRAIEFSKFPEMLRSKKGKWLNLKNSLSGIHNLLLGRRGTHF